MRLSEIRGERVLDVIADLVEPVSNIARDKVLTDAVASGAGDGDTSNTDVLVGLIPLLLKEHRRDVITILSVLRGVAYEEYVDDMTLASLISDAMEVLTDDQFPSFLARSRTTGAATLSGSRSEVIGDR